MQQMMMRAYAAGAGAEADSPDAERSLEEDLSLPLLLAERLRKAASDADSFRPECSELGRVADLIAHSLRALIRRLSSSNSNSNSCYSRPARRVAAEASKSLDRGLSLARRCRRRRSSLLRLVAAIATTGSADFRRALALLDASLADLRWLLSIYTTTAATNRNDGGDNSFDGDNNYDDEDDDVDVGVGLSLPPIASTDPILAWVWSCVAAAQMGSRPAKRAEAAASLATLALDSQRNRKVIVEEGAVPPLLSLLRDASSLDAQIAAATALANLAADRDLVSSLLAELSVPVIVQVLSDSPMRLQARLATLAARMAAQDPAAQEEFARENAVRPLVSLLSFEVPLDDPALSTAPPRRATSIHSLVRINRESNSTNPAAASSSSNGSGTGGSGSGSGRGGYYYHHQHHRKERENESPEVKLQLKVACAEALWMLSRGCASNSRKITETKGLLCLAKLIETEKGELQHNCLMTVVEIAAVAESDAELRRSAFKLNSPAAKAVVEQLLRVAQKGSSASLQIAAVRAIGSLARTFPAREARVMKPLVEQLGHWNPDVAAEAAVALGKFAGPENFLHVEHCKAIIEFGCVPPLMRLLRPGEKTQLPGLVLLCFLALDVPSNEALERAKALGTLESVSCTAVAQSPSLKELIPKAIYQLELFRAGVHPRIPIGPDAV